MKFSRDWLAQYVELKEDDATLRERLTAVGLAVDAVEKRDGDTIFDVDVTANRPDCMNHLGLARELAVLFDRPLLMPQVEIAAAPELAADACRILVEEPELCPRYAALAIRGVTVGPSPEWLRRKLEAIGSRSINNVVDVTNYVLWETGQPLHAFDLERLAGAEIRVRRARAGETLTTLDGTLRNLDSEILVIADAEVPVGLGGIMGGLDSEVTSATRHVLLESAHFNPATVRRGARKLEMHTDASHRFERGCDPEGCVVAAHRAAALIAELAGGQVLAGEIDVRRPPSPLPVIDLDLERLCRFAGIPIAAGEVERVLGGLGFALEHRGEGRWRVTVPSWRIFDFIDPYPADLYEEVLRIHGLDAIPSTLPQIAGSDAPESPAHRRRRIAGDHLAACGFSEAINFAFHDRGADASYPTLYEGRAALALANPLSDRYAVMRRSLLPNLIASARYNQRRGASVVHLFEIGHVFADAGEGRTEEMDSLAMVLGGQTGTPWERSVELDLYDLKGTVESLGEALGVDFAYRPATVYRLKTGTAAEIWFEDEVIGHLGELDEDEETLFVAEIALDRLETRDLWQTVSLPSRFPGIAVDLTLTHARERSWHELEQMITEQMDAALASFHLKDRYVGPGVPAGAVNTTISFLYNSNERSLTQDEVNERHGALARRLEEHLGWAGAQR